VRTWDELQELLPDPGLNPEQRVLQMERFEHLHAGMAWLSPQEVQRFASARRRPFVTERLAIKYAEQPDFRCELSPLGHSMQKHDNPPTRQRNPNAASARQKLPRLKGSRAEGFHE